MKIIQDDVTNSKTIDFLLSHLKSLAAISPPESMHALGLEALRKPGVTLWTAWDEDDLLGCAALKHLDANHAEVKSMRTAHSHLRKGVASRLVEFLILEAATRKYQRLSLETGAGPEFDPARSLYRKFGLVECGPFADYVLDPNSVFMTRVLTPGS